MGHAQVSQQVANIVLIVKFCTNTPRQTFHRQQVLGLGDRDAQVIEFQERREIGSLAQETLHCIVQPIGRNASPHGHAARGLPHFAGRKEQCINVMGGWPCAIDQTHDRAAYQEQFTFDPGLPQLLIE